MTATQKAHISELVDPADYCLVSDGTIVIRCPFCPAKMKLGNKPIQTEPLTLRSPVIGPDRDRNWRNFPIEMANCGHHFRIEMGVVKAGV